MASLLPINLFTIAIVYTAKHFTLRLTLLGNLCRFSVDVVRNHQSTATSPPASREGSDGTDVAKNGGGGKKTVDEASEKTRPMYVFTPVDRYGDNKEETKPLEDLGIST